MSERAFLSGRVRLHQGDCRDVLATLPAESVDSVVTDPPYHFASIVKRFGADDAAPAKSNGATGVYERSSRGFMGKTWDGGDIAFRPETWAAALRVLKPGGHLVAFGAPKNYHRLACAIEDAGFEVRDSLMWLFGSGFPKSLDVSKAIDKAAGAERSVISTERVRDIRNGHGRGLGDGINASSRTGPVYMDREITAPASAPAKEWHGWGTALKPAYEPIILARKPLAGTVAATVLAHGTGAINVNGCRVDAPEGAVVRMAHAETGARRGYDGGLKGGVRVEPQTLGRWPANVVHDGSDEVVSAFPDAPGQQRRVGPELGAKISINAYGDFGPRGEFEPRADAGSAARFFYTAKSDADDRLGSRHPTVKPVDLMRWLVRLVTPSGGTILDPFAGTGTTGEAAYYEGFSAVLIEREAEYCADIARRMEGCQTSPEGRKRLAAAAKETADAGPLFGGAQ